MFQAEETAAQRSWGGNTLSEERKQGRAGTGRRAEEVEISEWGAVVGDEITEDGAESGR